jgi:LmbE family N-acetylglucosaminyl deacetylase
LETDAASALLGVDVRENLCLSDAHLMDNQELRTALTRALRRHRPTTLCLPHWEDQHPDHAAVGQAGIYAAWLCGAAKFDAESAEGIAAADRPPYRPKRLLHYQNRYGIQPDLVLDVSAVIEQKMALVACFASQFNFPGTQNAGEPQTMLSSRDFEAWFRGSHAALGAKIRVPYGEAYCLKTPVPIHDVKALAL